MGKDTFLKKTRFRQCPKCGSKDINDFAEHMVCNACGYTLFFNCAAATSCIITRNDKILMVVRKNNPGKGMLDLPGGFVDYGESLEDGATREVLEEVGTEVSDIRYLASYPNTYLYRNVFYHTMDCFFVADLADDATVTAGDDAEAIIWVLPDEIDFDHIAFDSAKNAIKKFLSVY